MIQVALRIPMVSRQSMELHVEKSSFESLLANVGHKSFARLSLSLLLDFR